MKALNLRLLLIGTACLANVAIASPASAGGCNGAVNNFVWG
jgi:hypothetical protein